MPVYEEALALYSQRFGAEHADVADTHASLSRAYRRSGQPDLAEAHARTAVSIDRKVYSGDHWRLSLHLDALAMVLYERRAYDEALAAWSEGLRIRRATLGDDHSDTLSGLNNVGMTLVGLEEFAAAVPVLREALDRYIVRFGAEDYQTTVARANFGFALAESGHRREGQGEIDHAARIVGGLADPDPDLLGVCLVKTARVALDGGAPADALAALARLDAVAKALPSGDPYW